MSLAAADGSGRAAVEPPRSTAAAAPLTLTGLVMRRAAWVAAAVLAGALALGLMRVGRDIDTEVDAAMALATLVAGVSGLAALDDAQALAALRQLPASTPTRHLVLKVRTPGGVMVLGEADAAPAGGLLQPLLDLHRQWFSRGERRTVSWQVDRPGGQRWQVSLAASHEGERAEALANLAGMLLMLLLCVAGLLLVMRWNLRRALAPMGALLRAIAGIEHGDHRAVRALPAMPIHELETVARALRHMAETLQQTEAERRALGQRVITLQEDERARLARELHDEFGQHLTALRVDTAWLARHLGSAAGAGTPVAPAEVVADVITSMGSQVQHIQQELRSVLARLRPPPQGEEGLLATGGGGYTLDSLAQLLQSLVQGWAGRPAATLAVRLSLASEDHGGQSQPWPAEAERLALPPALALAVYRVTQEALSNVARHAQARQAEVRLCWSATGQLHWAVQDDGIGLADAPAALLRGSGLAGIKERIWSLGADLQLGPADARPGATRPGLVLQARLPLG